jgi:hypothetical protein
MEWGNDDPGQDPERKRGFWSKWTKTLTSEQTVKVLVALGRIAELIGVGIRHCG